MCFKDRESISQNNYKLQIPFAKKIPDLPDMKTKWKFSGKMPEGLIIHYTAGNTFANARDTISYANKQKHCYLVIDGHGDLYQQFDLARTGNHAGKSKCPVTGRLNVSKYYIGVEVQNSGLLSANTKEQFPSYKTWFGKNISAELVRSYEGDHFEKFRLVQEETLIKFCTYLCKLGMNPDLILGHNEVSPGRKIDPGSSLSYSMDKFRELIKASTLLNM